MGPKFEKVPCIECAISPYRQRKQSLIIEAQEKKSHERHDGPNRHYSAWDALPRRRLELDAQLAQFVQEVREHNERLVEEQRVCFKQLSLETSETMLMLDRTRRDLESRLDKLAGRLDK